MRNTPYRSAMLVCGMLFSATAFSAGSGQYYLANPYASVDWISYGQFKAAHHVHTTESDGGTPPATMIEEHYSKGFDILALTDHNFLSTTWDRTDRPANRPYLTTQRVAEMNAGVGRDGRGMISIPLSNEQSRHDHLNTFWAPFNNTSGDPLAKSITTAETLGGISHINHPGRYTGGSNTSGTRGEEASNNPVQIAKYVNLFSTYPSLVGMEVINKLDGDSYSDRILWDNVLTAMMPGRPVWGFSNDDAHSTGAVGFAYNLMLMPENTEANVRYSMENGTFYAVSRVAKRELGMNFRGEGPVPTILSITVDQMENSISIEGEEYDRIDWIADGQVIATGESIDINDHEESVTGYVRAQLVGPGGISFTQPFGVISLADAFANLAYDISGLDLNAGQKNSLTVKLDNAHKRIERNPKAAWNQLGAFVNEVTAMHGAGLLSDEDMLHLQQSVLKLMGYVDAHIQ